MIERYTRSGMKRIFSEQNKFKRWLDVELAALKGWEELGKIPAGTCSRVKKKAKFTIRGIQQIEKTTNHDVVAFTTEVAKSLGEDAKWIHVGLTSSDIVDTAQGLILIEAADVIITGIEELSKVLKALGLKHKDTIMMGRTHGIHAEPTTFGIKIAVWYDEMNRNLERIKTARVGIAVGKLSGAVGNFAHSPPELEEKVMRELGLKPAPATSQVIQRDRHAELMFALAILGGTLEKIAVTIRSLQRTEIGELFEPFLKGQKGSSAMPHKRNPITLERITGIARLLRANASAAAENQALWDERDISHSSVERVILADGFTLADYALDRMTYVLKNLEVDVRRMEENIQVTRGLHFSQTVLLKLVEKGLQREIAYEIVQRNAKKTTFEGTPFYDNLLKDGDLARVLDRSELAECFTNKHFTRHSEYILKRAGIIGGDVKKVTQRVAPKEKVRKGISVVQRRKPAQTEAKPAVRKSWEPAPRPQPAADAAVPNTSTGTSPGERQESDAARRHRRRRPRRPVRDNRETRGPEETPKPPAKESGGSQQEDWRTSENKRSVVDIDFRRMPDLKRKKKR